MSHFQLARTPGPDCLRHNRLALAVRRSLLASVATISCSLSPALAVDGGLDQARGIASSPSPAAKMEVPFVPFAEGTTISTAGALPYAAASADIDGDGDIDLALVSRWQDKLAWYENDGAQGFDERVISTSVTSASDVAATDVDGDGDVDLLVAGGGGFQLYVNDGDGNFSLQTIANISSSNAVAAADVDGDGDVDVLGATNDRFSWYENDGGGSFTRRDIEDDTGTGADIVAADLDRDGDMDMVTASFNGDRVNWYENDGSQVFTLRTVALDVDGASAVAVADIDVDGDLDVLSASSNNDQVAWHENDGAQGFAMRTIATSAAQPWAASAADVDGDGDIDVQVAAGEAVLLYENDGAQQFTEQVLDSPVAFGNSLIAVDLDRDGDTDVVATLRDDDRLAWYENRLIGASADFLDSLLVDTTADGAVSVAAADLDGDGDPDLVTGIRNTGVVRWYRNNGAGQFTSATVSNNVASVYSVATADVDGDGDLDVLSASFGDNLVAWHESNGATGFTQRTISTAVGAASAVTAADLDGDGDADVIAAAALDNEVLWFENDGSQGFTPRTISQDALGARGVFAIDLDRDGDIDVLSASNNDDKVAWYENDGLGNFTTHIITINADDVLSVRAADLDGDGDLDVVSASRADQKIAWYRNDGAQNFTERVITGNLAGANQVFTADLDADGDIDIQAAAFDADSITWYENDGAGNFVERPIAAGEDGAYGLAVEDIDGDGDLDVVSAAYGSDRVAWHRNCGGQFSFEDKLLAGSRDRVLAENSVAWLTRYEYAHLGRPGDSAATLGSLALALTDSAGAPLDAQQASTLYRRLNLYLDDGDGFLERADDTLVGSLESFAPNPAGVQAFPLNTGITVSPTQTATLFLEGEIGSDVTAQLPGVDFQIALAAEGELRPRAVDAASGAALSLACPLDGPATSFKVLSQIPVVQLLLSTSQGSEAEETVVTVTAQTSEPVTGEQSVDVRVSNADSVFVPLPPSDYRFIPDVVRPVLVIADGESSASVQLQILDDDEFEGTERWRIQLGSFSSGLTEDGQFSSVLQVLDNDTTKVPITVTSSFEDAPEGIEFTLTYTGPPTGPFKLIYRTDADAVFGPIFDTATRDEDFVYTEGTLDFSGTPDESQSVTVPIVPDTIAERDETFKLLVGADPGSSGNPGRIEPAVATIIDDDQALLRVADATITEGDAGTQFLSFPVSLEGAVDTGFTVAYATMEGTASESAGDYTAVSGTLAFAGTADETQTVDVPISGDTILENDETFSLQLSGLEFTGRNIVLADSEAIGTIVNDDSGEPPALAIADAVAEENGTLVFDVTLSGGLPAPFTVPVTLSSGSATTDVDFVADGCVLSFANAFTGLRSCAIKVTNDDLVEGEETLRAVLGAPSVTNVTVDRGAATGTIIDDDRALIFIDDVVAPEGQGPSQLEVPVRLSAPVDEDLQIEFKTAPDTAGSDDFETTNGTIVLPAQTQEARLAIPVLGDSVIEEDEQFSVLLNLVEPPLLPVSFADRLATVTLTNDDGGPGENPVVRPARFLIGPQIENGQRVGQIEASDPDGPLPRGALEIIKGTGFRIDPDNVLLVDGAEDMPPGSERVLIVRATDAGGRFGEAEITVRAVEGSALLGPAGDGTHRLEGLREIVVGNNGELYAAGCDSDNVFRVDADGIVERVLDGSDARTRCDCPTALDVSATGGLAVACLDNDKVLLGQPGSVFQDVAEGIVGQPFLVEIGPAQEVLIGGRNGLFVAGDRPLEELSSGGFDALTIDDERRSALVVESQAPSRVVEISLFDGEAKTLLDSDLATETPVGTAFVDVVVDSAGRRHVVDEAGVFYEIGDVDPATLAPDVRVSADLRDLDTGLRPRNLAVVPGGVAATALPGGRVLGLDFGSGAAYPVQTGVNRAAYLASDQRGRLFVADWSEDVVSRLDPDIGNQFEIFEPTDDIVSGDRFGEVVASSGELVAVGLPSADAGRGRVLIYRRSERVATLRPPADSFASSFGATLDFRGDLLVVGGAFGAGIYRVENNNSGVTTELLTRFSEDVSDFSVAAVALSADQQWVVLGSPRENAAGDEGAVYVYSNRERFATGNEVASRRILAPSSGSSGLFRDFGHEVAIVKDPRFLTRQLVAVSRRIETDGFVTGEVQVFGVSLGGDSEIRVTGPDLVFRPKTPEVSDFGRSLQFVQRGPTLDLVIGAPDARNGDGAVYVATIVDASKDKGLDPGPVELLSGVDGGDGRFGEALAIASGDIFVGAPGLDQGDGRVFRFDTDLSLKAGLLAPAGTAGFGTSLSTTRSGVVSGAPESGEERGKLTLVASEPLFADGFEAP